MTLVNLNQTTLFYLETGGGPPCLVMHGGLGLDHTCLHPWLDPLGDMLHLVYYDHRGNGRSGRPPVETLTHRQFVRDADAIREHLGFSRVTIMGHSYGGFIALEYALSYPGRVSRLILIDTAPAYNYGAEIRANLRRKTPSPEMLAAFRAPVPLDDAGLERLFKRVLPLYFHRLDVRGAYRLFANTIWSASAAARNEVLLPGYNVTSRLHQIRAPVLILVGRDDFVCPPSQAELLHRHLPDSKLVVLEHSGHFPYAEEPDAFFDAVRTWLGRVR